jgi:hypothetical protein
MGNRMVKDYDGNYDVIWITHEEKRLREQVRAEQLHERNSENERECARLTQARVSVSTKPAAAEFEPCLLTIDDLFALLERRQRPPLACQRAAERFLKKMDKL